jgi:hypothetical protein
MRCGGPAEPARGGRHVWRGDGLDRHGAGDARGPRTAVTRSGGCRRRAGPAAEAQRGATRPDHGQCRPPDALGDAKARAADAAAPRTDAAAGDAVGPSRRRGGRAGNRASGTAAAAQSNDAARPAPRRWPADAAARTGGRCRRRHAGQRAGDAAAVVPASEREPRRTERVAAVAAQRDQPPADAAGTGGAHRRSDPAGTAAGTGHHAAGPNSAAAHRSAHAVATRPADDAAGTGTGQPGRVVARSAATDLSDAARGRFDPAADRCRWRRASAWRWPGIDGPARPRRQPDTALLTSR